MSSNKFLSKEQEQSIINAIGRAEGQTSAEVRVHIESRCKADPLEQAQQIFHDLGMSATKQQNGVLIYIASDDKKAAVYGGKGIHEKVPENFWRDVLDVILKHFKTNDFEQGMVLAVEKVGAKLSELFPHQRGDVNELSDEISYNENSET